MCVCVRMRVCVSVCVFTYINVYKCVCVRMRVCVCVCGYIGYPGRRYHGGGGRGAGHYVGGGGGDTTDHFPGHYEISIFIFIVFLVLFIIIINNTDHIPGHDIYIYI